MTRVLPYLRQSEGKKGESADDALSLDAQLTAIRSWAAKEHWTMLPEIRDHDLKGDDPNRTGIKEMWQRVATEHPDLIAVFAMSRFARDNVWQELTWRQLRDHGVGVVSLTEPNIDHTLMRGLLGLVNEYQKEQISHFVKAAFARRVMNGLYHGEPPYGYQKVPDVSEGRPRKVLSHSQDEAPIVLMIYEWAREGWSYERIAGELDRQGVPARRAAHWLPIMVRKILRHPVYCGDVPFKGKVVARDAHPALIERATWEHVQRLLDARPVVKARNFGQTSFLEGLVRHGCGARMYRSEYHNPRGLRPSLQFTCRTAYLPPGQKCDVGRRHIGKGKVEQATRLCLATDLQGMSSLEEALVLAERRAGGDRVQTERTRLIRQTNELQSRRERAEHLYTTGRRSIQWFDSEDSTIQAALAEIEAALARLPQWPERDRYAQARELLSSWADVVMEAPGEDVAYALRQFGEVWVDAECLSIVYHPQYHAFIPTPTRIAVGRYGPSTYL